MATIERTVTLDDLTPRELAVLFCGHDAEGQAAFFSEIWQIARQWAGAGWCQQSYAIVEKLDDDGKRAIEALGDHHSLRNEWEPTK